MLIIEKEFQSKSLEKVDFLPINRVVLHFSTDNGKTWQSYSLSPKMLLSILKNDREVRDLSDGVEKYRKMNGSSYSLDDEKDDQEN